MILRLLVAAVLLGACTHRVAPPYPPVVERPPEAARETPNPPPSAPAPSARVVEFSRDVRPILQARCQPCHFEGGRMYEKLPFDRPETIHELGTRLFTRIKARDEQRLISEFLGQAK